MSRSVLWQIASMFGVLSLISIGGANVLLPEVHRQVVGTLGWMNDGTFAKLFAISQAAPGPNVMLASIIGWHIAGAAGLIVATLAMIVPSSLVAFFAGRGLARWGSHHGVQMLTASLVPIALGLMIASGVVAAQSTHAGMVGYAISGGAGAMVVLTKRNPLLAMVAGTLIFMLAHMLGVA